MTGRPRCLPSPTTAIVTGGEVSTQQHAQQQHTATTRSNNTRQARRRADAPGDRRRTPLGGPSLYFAYDSSGGKVFRMNHRRRHVLNSLPRFSIHACLAMPPAPPRHAPTAVTPARVRANAPQRHNAAVQTKQKHVRIPRATVGARPAVESCEHALGRQAPLPTTRARRLCARKEGVHRLAARHRQWQSPLDGSELAARDRYTRAAAGSEGAASEDITGGTFVQL